MTAPLDPEITGALIGGGVTLGAGAVGLAIKALVAAARSDGSGGNKHNGNGKITWPDLHKWCGLQHKPILDRLSDGDQKLDRLSEGIARIEEQTKHLSERRGDKEMIEATVQEMVRQLGDRKK